MKKKLLIIGPGMEIGGIERSLLGLLDSIDYERYDVDLFLLSHTGELMPLINKQANLLPERKAFSLVEFSIAQLFKKGHWFVGTIRLFAKLIGDRKAKRNHTASLNIILCRKIISSLTKPIQKEYDLALSFFLPHYFAEKKVNAKVKIGWVHTDYSNENEKQDTAYLLPMWQDLDYIACVSEQVKASFESVYPSLKSKTVVIENILSPEFVRSQAELEDVHMEMPPFEGTNILSVGRFCTAKNFDNVPAVCRILQDKGLPVKWYLIGYGPDEALIRSKIAEEGMEDAVIILGKKSNPYPYMKACDIYAQPSRYEGKAVTVAEAQILNKPVLISRYATASSQVEDGVDGVICTLSNEGIAQGLEDLIFDKNLQERLVLNTKSKQYASTEVMETIVKLAEEK